MRSRAPGKRAIVLHDVPDVPRFREFLDWLVSEYEILPLQDWLTCSQRDRTQLTLTFDDGYASWQETVAPLLAERNVPATFFVTSGVVGLRGARAQDFARERLRRTRDLRFIELDQLRALAQHPLFEIGNHTVSHADLGRISDIATAHEEIAGGQATLEDWMGTRVRWFSYPFGTPANISPMSRSMVIEAGMSAAFTLVPGWWELSSGDRFLIGRDGPDPSVSFSVWKAWLRGGYDRLYAIKTRGLRRW